MSVSSRTYLFVASGLSFVHRWMWYSSFIWSSSTSSSAKRGSCGGRGSPSSQPPGTFSGDTPTGCRTPSVGLGDKSPPPGRGDRFSVTGPGPDARPGPSPPARPPAPPVRGVTCQAGWPPSGGASPPGRAFAPCRLARSVHRRPPLPARNWPTAGSQPQARRRPAPSAPCASHPPGSGSPPRPADIQRIFPGQGAPGHVLCGFQPGVPALTLLSPRARTGRRLSSRQRRSGGRFPPLRGCDAFRPQPSNLGGARLQISERLRMRRCQRGARLVFAWQLVHAQDGPSPTAAGF